MSQIAHDAPELDIDSGAMAALEDELASIQSVRSVKKPLQLFADDMSNKFFMNPATSVLTIAVILICIALIGWNLLYRLPDLNQIHTLEYSVREKRLLAEELKTSLGALNGQDIDHQIEVAHKRIFSSYNQLAIWVNEAAELADALNLDMSYSVGNAHKTKLSDTIEMPITLTFLPADDRDESIFINSMEMIKQLLSEKWHLDIISTKALGNPNGLSSLQTTLQVWVSDDHATVTDKIEPLKNISKQSIRTNEEFIQ